MKSLVWLCTARTKIEELRVHLALGTKKGSVSAASCVATEAAHDSKSVV